MNLKHLPPRVRAGATIALGLVGFGFQHLMALTTGRFYFVFVLFCSCLFSYGLAGLVSPVLFDEHALRSQPSLQVKTCLVLLIGGMVGMVVSFLLYGSPPLDRVFRGL